MPTQVATLCECFLALGARKRSESGVLAEMVTQVAALLEGTRASRVLALEEQLHALGVRVLHLDRLVPFFRDAFEVLRSEVLLRLNPVFVVDHFVIFLIRVKVLLLVDMLTDPDVLGLSWVPGGVDSIVRHLLFLFQEFLSFSRELILWRNFRFRCWFLALIALRGTFSREQVVELAEPLQLLRCKFRCIVVKGFLTKSDPTRSVGHFGFLDLIFLSSTLLHDVTGWDLCRHRRQSLDELHSVFNLIVGASQIALG